MSDQIEFLFVKKAPMSAFDSLCDQCRVFNSLTIFFCTCSGSIAVAKGILVASAVHRVLEGQSVIF